MDEQLIRRALFDSWPVPASDDRGNADFIKQAARVSDLSLSREASQKAEPPQLGLIASPFL